MVNSTKQIKMIIMQKLARDGMSLAVKEVIDKVVN